MVMTSTQITNSNAKISRFKRWSGNIRTDRRTDAADYFTFSTKAVGNGIGSSHLNRAHGLHVYMHVADKHRSLQDLR